jgi:hypothetical protein
MNPLALLPFVSLCLLRHAHNNQVEKDMFMLGSHALQNKTFSTFFTCMWLKKILHGDNVSIFAQVAHYQ